MFGSAAVSTRARPWHRSRGRTSGRACGEALLLFAVSLREPLRECSASARGASTRWPVVEPSSVDAAALPNPEPRMYSECSGTPAGMGANLITVSEGS